MNRWLRQKFLTISINAKNIAAKIQALFSTTTELQIQNYLHFKP